MFYNLTMLRQEVSDALKKPTISQTRRDKFINEAQDEVAFMMDPDNLITKYEFTSVADQRDYYIDVALNKVLTLRDTTNQVLLDQIFEEEVEALDPEMNDSGTPYYYSMYGYSQTKGQPSSASVITISSSSASDATGSEKVRISGIVDGVEDTELLTLNGTSDVVGTKQFTEVRQLVKNTTTAGIVTVTANAAAVTLAEIPADFYVKEYQPIYLWQKPSGAFNYVLRGFRKPKPLVNAEDSPELPSEYHELVKIGAVIRGHADLFRNSVADSLFKREYLPKLSKLKEQMGNKRGTRAPVVRGGRIRPSIWSRIDEPLG